MELDETKIDEAVLALLYLTLSPRDHRAWKSFDWDAMNRLHEKGFILKSGFQDKVGGADGRGRGAGEAVGPQDVRQGLMASSLTGCPQVVTI